MTRPKLPPGQQRFLEAIQRYTDRHGYAPSTRDLCADLHMTPNGATSHLKALRKKGYIRDVKVNKGFSHRPARSIIAIPDGIQPGDRIQKRLGGSGRPVIGTAVSIFQTTSGVPHIVLEDALGHLHVYPTSQIVRVE